MYLVMRKHFLEDCFGIWITFGSGSSNSRGLLSKLSIVVVSNDAGFSVIVILESMFDDVVVTVNPLTENVFVVSADGSMVGLCDLEL